MFDREPPEPRSLSFCFDRQWMVDAVGTGQNRPCTFTRASVHRTAMPRRRMSFEESHSTTVDRYAG